MIHTLHLLKHLSTQTFRTVINVYVMRVQAW